MEELTNYEVFPYVGVFQCQLCITDDPTDFTWPHIGISYAATKLRTWISNHIKTKQWDVIIN